MKGYFFFCMAMVLLGCGGGTVVEPGMSGVEVEPRRYVPKMEHRRGQGRRDYSHESIPGNYDLYFAQAVRRYYPVRYSHEWHREKAKCWRESNLNPDAESGVGAVGLCQFMGATWKEVTHKYQIEGGRRNPKASIEASAAYSGELVEKFFAPRPDACRWRYANGSYNWGFGNVRTVGRGQGWPECPDMEEWPEEPREYVVRIEETIELLEGGE